MYLFTASSQKNTFGKTQNIDTRELTRILGSVRQCANHPPRREGHVCENERNYDRRILAGYEGGKISRGNTKERDVKRVQQLMREQFNEAIPVMLSKRSA